MDEVQISPIDAYVIARLMERLLLMIAHPGMTCLFKRIDALVRIIGAEMCTGIEIDLKGMSLLARGDVIEYVGHGAREDLGTVEQEGCEEGDLQFTSRMRKGINGGGGGNGYVDLLKRGRLGEICFGGCGFSEEGEFLTVHGKIGEDGIGLTCPMAGIVIGQGTGKAPDAEIGINGNERVSG